MCVEHFFVCYELTRNLRREEKVIKFYVRMEIFIKICKKNMKTLVSYIEYRHKKSWKVQ